MSAPQNRLNEVDLQILRAVNRFRYLTAEQLNRLFWPNNIRDENRYAQRRLRQLVGAEYLLQLRDLPRPARGSAPRVHALDWRGRKHLRSLGEPVPVYYRPSETDQASRNPLFMPHTLAVIDVLIAAERFTYDCSDVRIERLWTERDLRRLAPRVAVPGVWDQSGRQVAVIPDAIFTLSVAGVHQDFVLELDRKTERRQVWRSKTAALAYWIDSPTSRQFLTSDYVTVMVVAPDPERRDALRYWTRQELRSQGLLSRYTDVFVFTSESPVTLPPTQFFTDPHWFPPAQKPGDSLVDLPAAQASAETLPFRASKPAQG
jgi:hypothetical protein